MDGPLGHRRDACDLAIDVRSLAEAVEFREDSSLKRTGAHELLRCVLGVLTLRG